MGWFSAFREEGWPTIYGEQRTPVTADLVFVTILYTFSVLTAATIVVIIGIRGKGRWVTFLWALFSLQLGAILLLSITGHEWQVSYVTADCDYAILTSQKIHGDISIKVGLKSVNITLTGDVQTSRGKSHVHYNERFHWNKVDEMEEEYEKARERGLPQPILYIAEYFGADAGGLRWTRGFRQAGHFVYIALWAAFSAYLVSNILICLVVVRGALLLTTTGLLMLLGVLLYHVMQPEHPFLIHLEGVEIRLSYGVYLYLVLGSGLLTVIVGLSMMIAVHYWPLKVATFFLLDTSYLEEEQEEALGHADSDEIGKRKRSYQGVDNVGFSMEPLKEPSNGHVSKMSQKSPVKENRPMSTHDGVLDNEVQIKEPSANGPQDLCRAEHPNGSIVNNDDVGISVLAL